MIHLTAMPLGADRIYLMSSFDFLLDNETYSYSRLSTYDTCRYAFKLTYIDRKSQQPNFFSDYGTFIHETYESYFRGEVDLFDIPLYYAKEYNKVVVSEPPAVLKGIGEKYKNQGLEYFNEFYFDKSLYEIMLIEGTMNFELEGVKYVARPDLVIQSKEDGKIFLIDYKTSTPFNISKITGKVTQDKGKISGYHKQMYVYAYSLRVCKDIQVNNMSLWFPRSKRELTIPWVAEDEAKAVEWLTRVVNNIKRDEEFTHNNSNSFFCNQLCGIRSHCKYRPA